MLTLLLADYYHISIDELVGHEVVISEEEPVLITEESTSKIETDQSEGMAYLKKNFNIDYAASLNHHFLTKRVQLLEDYYDCLTVNDVYREIEYLSAITNCNLSDLTVIFGVSRSGFYYWKQNGDAVRKRNERIAQEILKYELPALDSAGYKAVTEYLHTFDDPELKKISISRVKRIMDEFEIIPEDLRDKKNAVVIETIGKYAASNLPIAENKIKREFDADIMPCTRWSVDITEIKTDEGKLFLCPVMDYCGRYILGYNCSLKLNTRLVRDAIIKAHKTAEKYHGISAEPIILHSDRGVQFRASNIRKLEEQLMIDASMSRAHTPNDNACIESFFASLKCEYLNRFHLDSIKSAKKLIDRYIHFYNNIRVHQACHMPPAEWWLDSRWSGAQESSIK